ncbi:MAG: hypothetical protein ACI8TA_002301 [Cyclobacteriaceae bacterium]
MKMGEMMAMGLPFITNRGVGDQDQLINDRGFVIDLKLNLTVDSINSVKINKHQRRDTDIKYFSLSNGIGNYIKVYNQLI